MILPRSKLAVHIFFLVLLILCLLGGIFFDWFYIITHKEQILTVTFWSWRGMHTTESIQETIVYDSHKNYHTAGFPQVDVVFQISIALAYSALASAGVAFVIAVLLLIFTNNQRLSVRCDAIPPKAVKAVMATLGAIMFLCSTLSALLFLRLMSAIRNDQNPVFKGIPCLITSPCYDFFGTSDKEPSVLMEWGPLHGWVLMIASIFWSLFFTIFSSVVRANPATDYLRV